MEASQSRVEGEGGFQFSFFIFHFLQNRPPRTELELAVSSSIYEYYEGTMVRYYYEVPLYVRFACTVKSFFGLFPRGFRRATKPACLARLGARGDSNVRDGCEASSDVQSHRVALKTRASKSPSLVWRVTSCGWRS